MFIRFAGCVDSQPVTLRPVSPQGPEEAEEGRVNF